MIHLGVLAVFYHYPNLSDDPRRMATRLRAGIGSRVGPIDRLSIFMAHEGHLPADGRSCDAWLVSGPLLDGYPSSSLKRVLVSAAHESRPLFGIWQGEHVLQAALAGQAEADGMRLPLSARNPLAIFTAKDKLYYWCDALGRIIAAPDAVKSIGRSGERRTRLCGGPAVLGKMSPGWAASAAPMARLLRGRGAGGAR